MYSNQSQEDIRIVHLTEYDPVSLLKSLPKPVFPIQATVEYQSTRESDAVEPEYSTPEYPVDVQIPQAPYIPETTVYFDNPAFRPPTDANVWSRSGFIERFSQQLDYIASQRSDEVQPRVTAISVVEIPYPYLITDRETGEPVAKSSLYQDEAEIAILEFSRDASISATNIKSDLDEGLPGDSRSPIRLTKLVEATAKPSRLGDETQQNPGRSRYFTASEAEKTGVLSRTPGIYTPADSSERNTRPLSPFIDELGEFVPVFMRECEPEIINRVKLTGEKREKTTFHATDVIR